MQIQFQQRVLRPNWDGRMMLFRVMVEEGWISCSISRSALIEVAACFPGEGLDLPSCFDRHRLLIDGVARSKHTAGGGRMSGRLHIWADDIVEPPPGNAPTAAALTDPSLDQIVDYTACRSA
ncbi:DUF1488 family protein [Teichococcus deserti]|uniref:DUF1488 family protein n=1 Tax=Teichococcus deserti TaxID=1817963 RepID=UPI0009775FFB